MSNILGFAISPGISQLTPLIQYFSTVGDGTGNINQAGAGGLWSPSRPGFFKVQARPNETILIHKIRLILQDDGTFDPDNYGGRPGLANGLQIETSSGGIITDSLDGNRVRTNADFYSLAGTVSLAFAGQAQQVMLSDFLFAPDYGLGLRLTSGDYVGLRFTDDLTAVSKQVAIVTGTVSFQ